MARFFCLLLLVPMGIGCQATQPLLLPEGYWEGVASLDEARFFFGLESKDSRISVHIPEMLISDAETDAKALKHGQISTSLPVGPGPTDRDGNSEQIVENNGMFWHLAQDLHEAGIASLRYDKLEVEESSFIDDSNAQNYSFEDSVHVARMLVSSIRADSRIQSIGIIGHSEGSLTGLLVARVNRDVRLVAEDDWFTRSGMSDYVRFKIIPQMGHRLKEADPETDITRSDRNRTMSLHPDLIITITTYIANI
jgi:hypothetical protein